MRELVYYVAVSIDGYIAAPDGSYDAFPVEGDHMAVYLSDFADALPAHVLAALGMRPPGHRFDTVIQGRASYDVARAAGWRVAVRWRKVRPASARFPGRGRMSVCAAQPASPGGKMRGGAC